MSKAGEYKRCTLFDLLKAADDGKKFTTTLPNGNIVGEDHFINNQNYSAELIMREWDYFPREEKELAPKDKFIRALKESGLEVYEELSIFVQSEALKTITMKYDIEARLVPDHKLSVKLLEAFDLNPTGRALISLNVQLEGVKKCNQ